MTLKCRYALRFKTRASFVGAHCENLNEDTIHCQRRRCRRCSQMTLLSGNIRFVPIFEGFLGEGASNDSGQSKTWIWRLSRLRLLHVKKWCQRYYIVAYYLIPCRLSTNPEMSLNDSEWSLAYTLQYCDLHLSNYFFSLISSCTVCLRTARDLHRGAGSGV